MIFYCSKLAAPFSLLLFTSRFQTWKCDADWLDVGGPHNWTSLFIAKPKLPHNLELLFSEILNLQTSQCQNNSVTKLVLLTLSLTANISMLQNWMLIDPNAVISVRLCMSVTCGTPKFQPQTPYYSCLMVP